MGDIIIALNYLSLVMFLIFKIWKFIMVVKTVLKLSKENSQSKKALLLNLITLPFNNSTTSFGGAKVVAPSGSTTTSAKIVISVSI